MIYKCYIHNIIIAYNITSLNLLHVSSCTCTEMKSREYSSDKMAHLPEDSLPGEFDVIIDGTGAPECVRIRTLSY